MGHPQLQLPAVLWAIVSLAAISGRAAEEKRTSEELYQQALRSTAWVRVYQDNKLRKMGTGFLVDRLRKLVVTNQHVVDNHESVDVVFPLYHGGLADADKKNYIRHDRPIRGWVVAMDPKRDLAVIELEVVPHAATAMKLSTDSACPGEHIHLIGNPGTSELLWVYNAGTVHQVSSRKLEDRRHGRVLDALVVEIRTRAAVKPGYSGGPAVNDRGELAGVATMSNPAANWAWCVDISDVRDVLRMVKEYPKAARRLLNPRSPADYQDREAYYQRSGPADHAIADYSEMLRRDPQHADAYFHRGTAQARRGEWDKAVADFTAALRLTPDNALMVYNRALAYSQKGSYDQALADFAETLRIDSKNGLAHLDRGLLYSRKGVHDLAIADFDQVLRLDAQETLGIHERGQVQSENGAENSAKLDYAKLLPPDPSHAAAFNTLAWVWATSPDANRRDGKKAVEYATKACELSGWKNASSLGTLAAAYAECANFVAAIHWEKQALEFSPEKDKAALRARLELYQAGKPFRDR
jgi:tetratricopeptide (TPR) repeat protein